MEKGVLLVFQKNGSLGSVKTRLAAQLGDVQALEIYRQLVRTTYNSLVGLTFPIWAFFSDFIPKHPDYSPTKSFLQRGEDLGARMKNAFSDAFKLGIEKVILIGTDCPELDFNRIHQAFASLDTADLVLGPAEDGGYYLIGMKKHSDFLFEGITWSTSLVFSQTIAKAENQRMIVARLPVLADIDTLEDWLKHSQG